MKIILFFLLFSIVKSWSQEGHMIIAQIAYQEITPQLYSKVNNQTNLYRHFYPKQSDSISASAWLDTLKGFNDTYFSTWHYIDLPFNNNTGYPMKSPSNINIVWALNNTIEQYQKGVDPWTLAFNIRLLLHLTGDVHEPMHCITLYDKQYPNGDGGGNLVKVHYNNTTTSLHEFWDIAGGLYSKTFELPLTSTNITYLQNQAIQLINKYNGSKVTYGYNVSDWADESYKIATNFSYQTGYNLNQQYITNTQKICSQRIYVAGMRLRWLLENLL